MVIGIISLWFICSFIWIALNKAYYGDFSMGVDLWKGETHPLVVIIAVFGPFGLLAGIGMYSAIRAGDAFGQVLKENNLTFRGASC